MSAAPRRTRTHHEGVSFRRRSPPQRGQYSTPIHSDECLNEHWFTSLAHTQVLIETWRREYNEERPKQGLGGLTPAQYAKRLVAERSTVTLGL